jgi:hypothetical protein
MSVNRCGDAKNHDTGRTTKHREEGGGEWLEGEEEEAEEEANTEDK